jgi:hypothetical protein
MVTEDPIVPGAAVAAGLSPRIDFRAGGEGHEYLVAGWSFPEKDYSWTLGTRSVIRLPRAGGEADCSLRFRGGPMVRDGVKSFQRLFVSINGVTLAQLVVRHILTLELLVPAALFGEADAVEVELHLPDATAPSELGDSADTRALGFWVSDLELTPLEPGGKSPVSAARAGDAAMLMEIQSLGANCELGFVQRYYGAEPFGLFRWSSTRLPNLLCALEARFEGLGSPDNIDIVLDGNSEFQVIDKRFGFKNHSFAFQDAGAKKDDILRRETTRLPFLTRLFLEDLGSGGKLFCFHDANRSPLDQIFLLADSLNRYGANTLLWVRSTDDLAVVGTAERLRADLIAGYVDTFEALNNVRQPSIPAWMKMIRAAYQRWRD